jgi:hypothetical protein
LLPDSPFSQGIDQQTQVHDHNHGHDAGRTLEKDAIGEKERELMPLPLPTLPRAESVTLLQKHAPMADADLLAEIAAELDDLPLALSLAGGFMETDAGMPFATPEKVLARLRQPDLLATAPADGNDSAHDEMAALYLGDALKRLADVGLLETAGENGRRLHRLIAAFTRLALAGQLPAA